MLFETFSIQYTIRVDLLFPLLFNLMIFRDMYVADNGRDLTSLTF